MEDEPAIEDVVAAAGMGGGSRRRRTLFVLCLPPLLAPFVPGAEAPAGAIEYLTGGMAVWRLAALEPWRRWWLAVLEPCCRWWLAALEAGGVEPWRRWWLAAWSPGGAVVDWRRRPTRESRWKGIGAPPLFASWSGGGRRVRVVEWIRDLGLCTCVTGLGRKGKVWQW